MLLPTSMLRSLAVICLFCLWAQAFSIDKVTCEEAEDVVLATNALVGNTMEQISQALRFVSDGIQKPIEYFDNTNEVTYKTPTEASFLTLSENADNLLGRWNWQHDNKQVDNLYFFCKANAFKPINDDAGNQWISSKSNKNNPNVAKFNGPSYKAKTSPHRPSHLACATGDMLQYIYSKKYLAIILCPPMMKEISQGYNDNKPINNNQHLEDYFKKDHFVLNVFRILYRVAFPQHTTSFIAANEGWNEVVEMRLAQALTNFYSFAYKVMALYFTTMQPGSAFFWGNYFDSAAVAAVPACDRMDIP
ncbi:hypothetical protein BDV95DRAFT_613604 [Massariosphaeria phaeospora]|uniref:Uncharacterized protein n=1 Tax=Massariosphaeria phaeospora TaxID=100035 RepID=A0A7C8MGT5_9PLEO|nr:hypothetical protein BDV95DRAFT_613604 [Massariosphaeria phaeospora]